MYSSTPLARKRIPQQPSAAHRPKNRFRIQWAERHDGKRHRPTDGAETLSGSDCEPMP